MFDREELLRTIRQVLREESTRDGDLPRPLGEVVPLVYASLGVQLCRDRKGAAISIAQVAAFVDGRLSNEESRAICHAVTRDNSVLAELIAAVRSEGGTASPLSSELTNRLLELYPNTHATVPTPVSTSWVNATAADGVKCDFETEAKLSGHRQSDWRFPQSVTLAVLAATVILAVLFAIARPPSRQAVDSEEGRQDNVSLQGVEPPVSTSEAKDRQADADNVAPNRKDGKSPTTADEQRVTRKQTVNRNAGEDRVPYRSPKPDGDSSTTALAGSSSSDDGASTLPQYGSSRPLAGLRDAAWEELDGLLLRQSKSSGNDSAAMVWTSISAASSSANGGAEHGLTLRTLPSSLASCPWRSGKVVLAADTRIDLHDDSTLRIHHGSIAFVRCKPGTPIQLDDGQQRWSVRWRGDATAVFSAARNGIRVDVEKGGRLTIDGEELERDAAILGRRTTPVGAAVGATAASGRATIIAVDSRPLPEWSRGKTNFSGMPRNELRELGAAANVQQSLSRRFAELAARDKLSAKQQRLLRELAQWRAALAEPHLIRLVKHQHPVQRDAALHRLIDMPASDPRYAFTWQQVHQSLNNQRMVQRFQRWALQAQRRGGLSPTQVEQLLVGLQSDQFVTRAVSDYLLRRHFVGGPLYDPAWQGRSRARAVQLWRQTAGNMGTGRGTR